jgi:hypothetical protein
MSTSEQQTCGKGLTENSILPRKLGQLIAAMAENLAVHSQALDLTDQTSRAEYAAYEKLVRELRQTAAQLERTANQMAGYRELPMGRHDEKAMTHPRVLEVFEQFVKQKQQVMSMLEQTAARDNELLEMMHIHIR